MTTTKQTLCRPLGFYLANVATRLGFLVLICALPGLMAQAWAANPASAAAAAPAATPATPDQVLTQSVQQWVSSQQGLRPEQVQVLPMDARVRVQACARPLLMDLPFVGNETVRVRCPEPVWQLYVRVQSAVKMAAMPAASATPQASETRRMVLVATQNLVRGMAVGTADVREQMQVLPPGGSGYLDQVSQAVHSELVRDIPAGTPLRSSDLRPLILVKRGQLVQLNVGKSTGCMVSARVEALQDGRMGEVIKLKSPESGRMLSGVVRGPNLVEGP